MVRVTRICSKDRVWLTAVRPFAYTASAMAVALGVAIARHAGYPIRWVPLAITMLGVLCFHTGANLLNDCFDHRRGLDTQVLPTSGAVVRGWLTEAQVFRAAAFAMALGAACGLFLAWHAGWVVLLLGALGAVCALGYTTPRFCFKCLGGGDFAIFAAFGVLPVFGAFWVQTRQFDWLPVLWSVPIAMLAVGILHANNWRDIESDPGRGCRTIAGMLGVRGSARYYRLLVLGPFGLAGIYILPGCFSSLAVQTPPAVLIAFMALPLAIKLSSIKRSENPQAFAMLDGKTAQLHLLFSVLASVGFLLGRNQR